MKHIFTDNLKYANNAYYKVKQRVYKKLSTIKWLVGYSEPIIEIKFLACLFYVLSVALIIIPWNFFYFSEPKI